MLERGLSAHRLEQEAGLKRSAVQNILQGRSRKPSAEILYAIAKILDCPITELLENSQPQTFFINESKDNKKNKESDVGEAFQFSLYIQAVQQTENILHNQKRIYPRKKILEYIREIYQYSLDNKLDMIDKRFAYWLAHKWWGIEPLN